MRKTLCLRLLVWLLWTAAVFGLSLKSSGPHVPEALSWDKLQHALAYGLLALLTGRVLILFLEPLKAWPAAGIFAVVIGGLLEVLQGLMTEVRRPEFGDLVADLVGIGLVCGICLWRDRNR